jgi:hypothetical protein
VEEAQGKSKIVWCRDQYFESCVIRESYFFIVNHCHQQYIITMALGLGFRFVGDASRGKIMVIPRFRHNTSQQETKAKDWNQPQNTPQHQHHQSAHLDGMVSLVVTITNLT